jgi:ribosomal protein S18 acetylase RimI-like enzyme
VTVTISVTEAATPALAAALERLLPELTGAPAIMTVERLARLLAQPSFTLLIATDEDGRVVGTASVVIVESVSGWVARLEDVVVDGAARGQGVGAALTEAAIKLATARGVHGLDLTSAPHREAANRLYQRLGFQRRITNVYRHPLKR